MTQNRPLTLVTTSTISVVFMPAMEMPSKPLILLFFVYKIIQVHPEDCSSFSKCHDCIHAPSCSWYLEYRSANGSGCFKSDHLEDKTENGGGYSLFPPKSSFYVVKNEHGGIIWPQEVSLNLRLNEPFTFPITFTPRREWGKTSVLLKHKKQRAVELVFFSNCGQVNGDLVETHRCDDVEFENPVEFWVKVEQKKCSKRQPEQIKKIKIVFSPSNTTFFLDLYAYCYCPCEIKDPHLPETIPECRKRGSFKCGVCYCNEGFAGKDCEVNTSNRIS